MTCRCQEYQLFSVEDVNNCICQMSCQSCPLNRYLACFLHVLARSAYHSYQRFPRDTTLHTSCESCTLCELNCAELPPLELLAHGLHQKMVPKKKAAVMTCSEIQPSLSLAIYPHLSRIPERQNWVLLYFKTFVVYISSIAR